MTKPKYASAAERQAALSEQARKQMLAQWERQRGASQDSLGYFGCHRRVRKERGRAADQTCTCGAQARHWAHIHNTDPADPKNYMPLCQKCHWRYDGVGAATVAAKSPEERRAIALKAWETKRRNQEEQRDLSAAPLAGP